MSTESEDKLLLPHHVQQSLCTTRLPYRQGRKLTAVKAYTVNNESNHLLIFGVPSLKLRQETKALFLKFGKLLQFHISTTHPAEMFTETYHAVYERIQSARIAKRMLDTKNFYGGSLHVCYAPELETVDETRQKILQRKRDVLARLKNLERDEVTHKNASNTSIDTNEPNNVLNMPENLDNSSLIGPSNSETKKLDMGQINTISMGKQVKNLGIKRKLQQQVVIEKKFKPCFIENTVKQSHCNTEAEVVDCTSVDKEIITNVNEHLNYNKFGNEVIKKIPIKPLNVIKFHIDNKKII